MRRHRLVQFFADLGGDGGRVGPVEADAACPLPSFSARVGAGSARLTRQDVTFRPRPYAARRPSGIPRLHAVRPRPRCARPRTLRMPADHLVADGCDDVAEIEGTQLLRHARVEHDLQQQVTEFVAQILEVVRSIASATS